MGIAIHLGLWVLMHLYHLKMFTIGHLTKKTHQHLLVCLFISDNSLTTLSIRGKR